MTTYRTTEEELGRRVTIAFFEEIAEMLTRDDIERIFRRILTVAKDLSRADRSLTTRIIVAINNFNENKKNKTSGLIDDERYYAKKNQCLSSIINIAQDIQDLLEGGGSIVSPYDPSSRDAR